MQQTPHLLTEEYNDLGTAVSHGCVRLQAADAKWVYENCPGGTTVVIYDDAEDPGPFGVPQKAVAYLDPNGEGGMYDPTDPVEGNPWRGKVATGISLNSDRVELTVGHSLSLTATVTPAAAEASLRWQSPDPAVATVDENGRVLAHRAGTARISVNTGSYYAHAAVTVSGEALRFTDVAAGRSYYDAVRFVDDNGLMSGSGDRFSPEERLSRGMGFQILYNLSGDTVLSADALRYSEALSWVKSNGLSEGMLLEDAFLQKGLSREELAMLLHRYERTCRKTAPRAEGDVTKFGDWDRISSGCEQAVAWAVGAKLLRGDGAGMLRPNDPITRGEAAEMLWRYMESRAV